MDNGDSLYFLTFEVRSGGESSQSFYGSSLQYCHYLGDVSIGRSLEGIHLLGLFERKGKYIRVPFLVPEDIKILSLEAIWNFGKGTGLS